VRPQSAFAAAASLAAALALAGCSGDSDSTGTTTQAVTAAGGVTAPPPKVLGEDDTMTVDAATLETGFQVSCNFDGQRVNFESSPGEVLRTGELIGFPDGPSLVSASSGHNAWTITCRRSS